MLVVWDEPKRASNLRQHGKDFAHIRHEFEWETAFIDETYSGSRDRVRFLALGYFRQELVALVFSPLGSEAISAISLRRASRKERKRYADAVI